MITCVVESNEPVFDPSDSDEAADQGPTLVDSDDEPSPCWPFHQCIVRRRHSDTCRAFSGCSECNVTQRVGLTQIDSDKNLW